MEVALISNGVVTNRIVVSSVEEAGRLFPGHTAVEDNDRIWMKGSDYTE